MTLFTVDPHELGALMHRVRRIEIYRLLEAADPDERPLRQLHEIAEANLNAKLLIADVWTVLEATDIADRLDDCEQLRNDANTAAVFADSQR